MPDNLSKRLLHELEQLVLIDPHTHINPHSPASTTLADIMGYHYYTELAHSAGLEKSKIEEPGLEPKEKVGRLVGHLDRLDNTIQVSWLLEMCQKFFGFTGDRITSENWESLYDAAEKKMAEPDWEDQVLSASKIEQIFLTNDFDDPLDGFDTKRYIPCLRTDDLVFHLVRPEIRQRLAKATGIELSSVESLVLSLGKLFEHFVSRGARACAISLPPDFAPVKVERSALEPVLQSLLVDGRCGSSTSLTISRAAAR
jgi:glucuronate isomerase